MTRLNPAEQNTINTNVVRLHDDVAEIYLEATDDAIDWLDSQFAGDFAELKGHRYNAFNQVTKLTNKAVQLQEYRHTPQHIQELAFELMRLSIQMRELGKKVNDAVYYLDANWRDYIELK